MVSQQTAYAFASDYAPRQPASRAKAVAIGASVAVHLLIGAYVLTAVVQPMRITEIVDPPDMTAPIVALPKPDTPRPPMASPPHNAVHETLAPADPNGPILALTPQDPIAIDQPKTLTPFDTSLAGAGEPPRVVRHVIINPSWLSRPNGDQLAKAYPERAARLGVSGAVVLDCRVMASGSVGTCDVISETPADLGFAKAALSLGHLFRMQPRTEDGQAVDGGTTRIPVRFAIQDG